MTNKTVQSRILLILAMTINISGYAANQQYISDEFEVTMRSGTSISNSIVRMLKSGERVTILEQNLADGYSLVEAEDGKQGYVLNRFLMDNASAKQRLGLLQKKMQQQQTLTQSLQTEVKRLKADLELKTSDNNTLKSTLLASENELARVKNAAENTLNIIEKNEMLETMIKNIENDKSKLKNENEQLKDSTRLDWFIAGAAVFLSALLLGMLVTRIRWRKKDSWGSY